MKLYILRHGIAVDHGMPGINSDADRPLTPKGERKVQKVAAAMRAMELSFDAILSSPFLRAKQTAEIIAVELSLQKVLSFNGALVPGGSPKVLIEHIKELRPEPGRLLLVGHEPYLSCLVALLTSGGADVSIDLKKGGFCRMEVESLRHGRCATLCWLLTPRQMELMA